MSSNSCYFSTSLIFKDRTSFFRSPVSLSKDFLSYSIVLSCSWMILWLSCYGCLLILRFSLSILFLASSTLVSSSVWLSWVSASCSFNASSCPVSWDTLCCDTSSSCFVEDNWWDSSLHFIYSSALAFFSSIMSSLRVSSCLWNSLFFTCKWLSRRLWAWIISSSDAILCCCKALSFSIDYFVSLSICLFLSARSLVRRPSYCAKNSVFYCSKFRILSVRTLSSIRLFSRSWTSCWCSMPCACRRTLKSVFSSEMPSSCLIVYFSADKVDLSATSASSFSISNSFSWYCLSAYMKCYSHSITSASRFRSKATSLWYSLRASSGSIQ